MLDEDNLNEMPKSSVVNLSDETTGNPQLERSTEIAKTHTTIANSEVRNLRPHPFVTYSLLQGEKRHLKLVMS